MTWRAGIVLRLPSDARFVAVDWSGAKKRAERKIWLAEVVNGRLTRLENGRSRQEVINWLIQEARSDPNLVVGLDFAFSFPAWFLTERRLQTVWDLWECVAREGDVWLRDCEPPFWGRPGRRRPGVVAEFRQTERTMSPVQGIRPKSVFQIGGAGAVGTGSIRGMPMLRELRAAGFSIWPFEPPKLPVVVEIYPRLLTNAVTKTCERARMDYLERHWPELEWSHRRPAVQSDDAFDAAVSALIMGAHRKELELPPVTETQYLLEGKIWSPSQE